MATHPYISGAGNITQMIAYLRKNFPSVVNSETVKKLNLASNNESYVINSLQFIGIIDEEGRCTGDGLRVFSIHDDLEFQKQFSQLIKSAYKGLFELRGEESWNLDRGALINYFRTSDRTSDAIGGRQANVFKSFAALSGHGEPIAATKLKEKSQRSPEKLKSPKTKTVAAARSENQDTSAVGPRKKDVALTVRIEINLPAECSRETYDHIFKSIKANLVDE